MPMRPHDPRRRPGAPPARRAFAAAALLLALAPAGVGPGRAAPAMDPNARLAADSSEANRLMRAGKVDSAFATFAAGLRVIRASGDRRVLMRALYLDGRARSALGIPTTALPELLESAAIAEAVRDTATWVRVLRWQTYSYGNLGRMKEKDASARRELALAEAIGDVKHQANARTFLGWDAHQRGEYREAIAQLEWASARLHELKDPDEALALVTLGSAQLKLDQFDRARRTYHRSLEVSRAANNWWMESQALNDLGTLESTLGDPAAAAAAYAQAYESHKSRHEWPDALNSLSNVANAEIALGRYDEGIARAREGVAICEERGLRMQLGWGFATLGGALESAGRNSEAARTYRAVLALGDSTPVSPRISAAVRLSSLLVRSDSTAQALELVEHTRRTLASRASVEESGRLEYAYALALANAKRLDGSLAAARAAADLAERDGQTDLLMDACESGAWAARRLGRDAEAVALLERAERAWVAWRGRPSDPEWREVRGAQASDLSAALVTTRLELPATAAARARLEAAFATAQRFKNRTLLERMAGPAGGAPDSARWADASLARLQRDVLRDGELLLEFVEGQEGSVVFAVTRDTCAAATLPGRGDLRDRLQLVRDLMSRPPGRDDRDEAAAAATTLGATLWGAWTPLLERARTILVAPDGQLHLAPFEMLAAGGARSGRARAVVRVPSATLLAVVRAESAARPSGGGAMLAFAGGVHANGALLDGALREVRSLGRRYRGVTVRTSLDTTGAPMTAASFVPFGALHFAGHTVVDDQTPWRSGITVLEAATRESLRVTASDVAASRQPAALAVLSSCESAGGRIRSGEGVAGLSTAFLAAGVPAVVATLWPVDDRTTERFTARLYAGLGRGLSAAEALEAARLEIARDPATAHPFFWAGYALVGEPGAHLVVRANPLSPFRIGLYLLLAAVLAAGLLAWRGARRLRGERGV